MEIKYTRTYKAKNGKMTAGEINALLGCAMEIYEMRPALESGKLGLGEICVMLFALTPEEYALRETDVQKFEALEGELRKNVPQDRMLGVRVVDIKGTPVQREIKLKTGSSIDGGALLNSVRSQANPIDAHLLECARLQKLGHAKDAPDGVKQDWQHAREKLGAALLQLDKIIVADDALTGRKFPAVGFDGRVEIFTTTIRAERAKAQFTAYNENTEIWSLREIARADFTAFFKRCAEFGFPAFRVDNGFASAELNLNDFLTEHAPSNAILRGNIVREIEFALRWKNLQEKKAEEKKLRSAMEGMLTFRNFAWREAGRSILYAACIEANPDGEVLCTASARTKLDPESKAKVVSADKFMIMTNQEQKRHMIVFTSPILAAAFAEKRDASGVSVAMTFDDIKQRMNSCDGLVVDPETLGYVIHKDKMDEVIAMRDKPPVVVRIQPPKPAEKPVEAEKHDSAMESLPDPDAAGTSAAKPKQEIASDDPESRITSEKAEKPEKKGFFKRLFGK